MQQSQTTLQLSILLRRAKQLEAFLCEVAPDVVATQRYLSDPRLALQAGSSSKSTSQ